MPSPQRWQRPSRRRQGCATEQTGLPTCLPCSFGKGRAGGARWRLPVSTRLGSWTRPQVCLPRSAGKGQAGGAGRPASRVLPGGARLGCRRAGAAAPHVHRGRPGLRGGGALWRARGARFELPGTAAAFTRGASVRHCGCVSLAQGRWSSSRCVWPVCEHTYPCNPICACPCLTCGLSPLQTTMVHAPTQSTVVPGVLPRRATRYVRDDPVWPLTDIKDFCCNKSVSPADRL